MNQPSLKGITCLERQPSVFDRNRGSYFKLHYHRLAIYLSIAWSRGSKFNPCNPGFCQGWNICIKQVFTVSFSQVLSYGVRGGTYKRDAPLGKHYASLCQSRNGLHIVGY